MTATATMNCSSGSTPIHTPCAELEARDLDLAGLEPAAVGGEQLQQRVLDDDREPERHQQRRQQVVAERAVEQRALQPIADRRHDRHDDEDARAAD